MIENPKISVIIPCFNQGVFLENTIKSVLLSTYKNYDIIVINDGSTDPQTQKILQEAKWPNTRIIHQKNSGVSAARNHAIKESNSKYFLPLDADDAIADSLLKKAVDILENNDELGFVYPQTNVFGNIREYWKLPPYNFYKLLWRNHVCVCALTRKQAWLDAGGYDENMHLGYEDWDFWIRLGKNGWYGQLIPEPLFYYRRHGQTRDVEAKKKHKIIIEQLRVNHPEIYTNEQLLTDLKLKWSVGDKTQWSPITYLKRIWRSPLFPSRLRTILRPPPPLPDWLK